MTMFSATARLQHLAAVAAAMLAASIAFSAPAAAAEKADAAAKVASAGAAAASTAVRPAKKYCVIVTHTGSRLPKKVCDTAEGWRLSGEDIGRR